MMTEVRWVKKYGRREPGKIEVLDSGAADSMVLRGYVEVLRRLSDKKPRCYSAMTVSSLTALLRDRGVEVPKKATREMLVAIAREMEAESGQSN